MKKTIKEKLIKIKQLEQQKKIVCKCGHNHIAYCGDLMREGEGNYRINECCECNCENWEEKE